MGRARTLALGPTQKARTDRRAESIQGILAGDCGRQEPASQHAAKAFDDQRREPALTLAHDKNQPFSQPQLWRFPATQSGRLCSPPRFLHGTEPEPGCPRSESSGQERG